MAKMTTLQKYKFWRRQGFDFFEALHMLFKPLERKVVVALKKLRIENHRRKRDQQLTA